MRCASGRRSGRPPDIRDVTVEENQPLTFTASFDTVPAFETGDYAACRCAGRRRTSRRKPSTHALQRLRERAARFEPVEGRGVDHGDTVTVDLDRKDAEGKTDTHKDVNVELGAKANPPGFDEQLLGLEVGATKTFTVQYPSDYAISELAGQDVSYNVLVKGLKRRVLPELDDEFAKDMGQFDTLDALKSARSRRSRARGAACLGAGGARRSDEAAGQARAVRGAAVARRA